MFGQQEFSSRWTKSAADSGIRISQTITCLSFKRSSAELLSCLDLCGLALNISMAMTEILLGPKSATELTSGLNDGKLALETEVVIDAAVGCMTL